MIILLYNTKIFKINKYYKLMTNNNKLKTEFVNHVRAVNIF